MAVFEDILAPHLITLGSSAKQTHLAVVSINTEGNPGNLNMEVFQELGYPDNSFPRAHHLNNGFYLLEQPKKIPILFIVTVGTGNTSIALNENLYNGLVGVFRRQPPLSIWIPLLGTGSGGLSFLDSYIITVQVLNSLFSVFKDLTTFVISIPKTKKGEELYRQIIPTQIEKLSLKDESDATVKRNQTENFKPDYYLGGSFWSGNDMTNEFIEKGLWRNGHDTWLAEKVNGVRVGDVIFIKSTFAARGISYLRIKAVGRIIENPRDGSLLRVDWRIPEITDCDIENLGHYRDAFESVRIADIETIVNKIGKDRMMKAGFPVQYQSTSTSSSVYVANLLQKTKISNDSALHAGDDLGFRNDVRAFASLIALKELSPPLAIALFGKWGSGKSTFMFQLQKTISSLSQNQSFEEIVPQNLSDPSIEKPFCEGVVQITFNAWSYMDANLWASIVSNIFEKLDDYLTNKAESENIAEARKILGEELSIVSQEKNRKLEEKKALLSEKDATISEINNLEKRRSDLLHDLADETNAELYSRIKKDIHLEQDVLTELNKYGYSEATLNSIQPRQLFDEIKSWNIFIKAIWKFSTNQKWIFSISTLIILFVYINPNQIIDKFNIASKERIIYFFSIIGPLLLKLRQAWFYFKKIYAPVKEFKDKFNNRLEKIENDHKEDLEKLKSKLEQKNSQLENKKAELENLDEKIALAEFELEHSITQKAFFDFIKNKSKDEKYEKSLSIISTIRKDFETLSQLFYEYNIPKFLSSEETKIAEAKKEKIEKFKKLFKKPLDRIVLYIDDLDRCSEDRVTEVLEAVNLLMAFPLFVVVVGVDPRWVKTALFKKYTLQFTGILNGSGSLEKYGIEPIKVTDYLEKIFQIPFHLKEPNQESVGQMLNGIFGSQLEDDIQIIHEEKNDPQKEGLSKTLNPVKLAFSAKNLTGINLDHVVESNVQKEEKLVSFRPKDLKIGSQELTDLKDLAWLVGNNPRSLKRYANMYRIVRAHENLAYAENEKRLCFLCVIFILGFSIGSFRDSASDFYDGCVLMPDDTLEVILGKLKEEKHPRFRKELKSNKLPEALQQASGQNFTRYINFVKRFSFETVD